MTTFKVYTDITMKICEHQGMQLWFQRVAIFHTHCQSITVSSVYSHVITFHFL